MILIISTPDVSCKHFISHGLSVEPWSFYSCTYKCLTLEMSLRRNLTPQRRSLIKLLLLFVLPARLSSSVLSFWDFFFLKYIRTIFTYVKAMIWRTLLQGRDLPFPPGLAEAPAGELCGAVPALQSLDICDRSKEERLP